MHRHRNDLEIGVSSDVEGVYLLFFRDAAQILRNLGYYSYEQPPLIKIGDAPLLYLGSSISTERRIQSHINGDSRQSNLRVTLACALREELNLKGYATGLANKCHFGAGEARLTLWIKENLVSHTITTREPRTLELCLIKQLKPPLNIKGRQSEKFAQHLMKMREIYGFDANLPFARYRRPSDKR